jgi:Phosphoesterase family.
MSGNKQNDLSESQDSVTAMSLVTFPKPDHIVVVIVENHRYSQLIGSGSAPYINSLINDSASALFTESFAIAHPSQPNYIMLYSGNAQGVTDDLMPSNIPFTTPNLGRQLVDSGKTFITYSEGLPVIGYNGASSGWYARKHNPAANWMGTGKNQVSSTVNQPFTAFPSNDFSTLPTVSFIIPNLIHDMHDGTDPVRIKACDDWISTNLGRYVQWAKANNSLFILTFDEDDYSSTNQILTIFTGQMVKGGKYSHKINHYTVLHTIEKLCGLPYLGDSLRNAPIASCWK